VDAKIAEQAVSLYAKHIVTSGTRDEVHLDRIP